MSNRTMRPTLVAASVLAFAAHVHAQTAPPTTGEPEPPPPTTEPTEPPTTPEPTEPVTEPTPVAPGDLPRRQRPLPAQGRPIGRSHDVTSRDPDLRIEWNPRWPRVGIPEVIIGGLGGAAAIVGLVLQPTPGRWTTPFAFDDSVRNALRLSTANARGTASDVSDVLLSVMLAYPYLIDAMTVTWWHRNSGEVAVQMTLIDMEAMAISGGLQGITSGIASRERPYGHTCGVDLAADTSECTYPTHYRSFFSGHTVEAFTSATVTCINHLALGLYGGGAPDIATCATGYVIAGAVGTLRIVSDNHYLSDVVIGALVGTAVGVAVPMIHYRGIPRLARNGLQAGGVTASVVPTGSGAALVGMF